MTLTRDWDRGGRRHTRCMRYGGARRQADCARARDSSKGAKAQWRGRCCGCCLVVLARQSSTRRA